MLYYNNKFIDLIIKKFKYKVVKYQLISIFYPTYYENELFVPFLISFISEGFLLSTILQISLILSYTSIFNC
jgi:hypothetical protein